MSLSRGFLERCAAETGFRAASLEQVVRLGELLDRAWSAVAPLLRLTPAEAAYVTAAQEGDLRLDLLFPADAGEARRLGEHPALQWKIQNARQHAARPRQGGG